MTVRSLAPAFLVVLLAGASPLSPAQEVTARARVDSTSFLLGDWITVHVDITHPPGVSLQPIVGDTLNGFIVVERGALEQEGESATRTRLIVARYDSGRAVLPPLPFVYTIPGDSAARTVSTNPLVLTVRPVPVDTAGEIKDVKPPLGMSLTIGDIAVILGVLLVLAALVVLYRRYRKRRQREASAGLPAPPPRPAHVIALEELAILKEKKLWQQGFIKQYYSEVTEVVRRYFENRFHFMALEQTTDEIMNALRRKPGTGTIHDESERMLRTADLVKFAKYQPEISDHEEVLRAAYDIVEKTRVAPPPAPTTTPQPGETHAGI